MQAWRWPKSKVPGRRADGRYDRKHLTTFLLTDFRSRGCVYRHPGVTLGALLKLLLVSNGMNKSSDLTLQSESNRCIGDFLIFLYI